MWARATGLRHLRHQLAQRGASQLLSPLPRLLPPPLPPAARAALPANCGRLDHLSRGVMARAATPPEAGHLCEKEVEKRRVREAVKSALRQLSAEQMAEESRLIARTVLASRAFREAPHAVIYVHCAKLREVDTTEVLVEALAERKRLYVPRVQDKDANMHFLHLDSLSALQEVPPFGIREPRPTYDDGSERHDVMLVDEPLELVIMPGLGFDRSGRRLGRGGGYYDKFINAMRARAQDKGWAPPLLVALSYRAQLVDQVPVEPHDAPVDAIVTADGVIACSPGAEKALRSAESGGG